MIRRYQNDILPLRSTHKSLVRLFFLQLLLLATTCTFCNANSLNKHHEYIDSLVKNQTWTNGATYIGKMSGTVNKYSDYKFDSKVSALKSKKVKTDKGKFYFKKQKLIRIECKSGGVNKGAIVVKRPDGKIRGAGGGMLKFMKMNLEPDSRMLVLANGLNVMKSDFASLLNGLKRRASGGQVKITSSSITDKSWNTPVKVLEVKKGNRTTDRVFISTRNSIPVEWDLYNSGRIHSIARFDNFRGNCGLKSKLFEL